MADGSVLKPAAALAEHALVFDAVDVSYRVRGLQRSVLRQVSFAIGRGEAYGLVGESGCGKSTVALSAVRYLPRNGMVSAGTIKVNGRDIVTMGKRELRDLRRTSVSMVYQDPGRALNPSLRIGRQVAEVYEINGQDATRAKASALEILDRVQISDPRRVAERYPHQLSGGMQQRVGIAMALARNPALLILDEPTTGLDVTVEAEVLDLVEKLRREFSTSILFISHNLAIVARVCERVGVLYAGRLIEEGPTREIFDRPRHPYTVGLLRCLPQGGRVKTDGPLETIPGFPPSPGSVLQGCTFAERCQLADVHCRAEEPPMTDLGGRLTRCYHHALAPDMPRAAGGEAEVAPPVIDGAPLLMVSRLSKTFGSGGHQLKALQDVSFELRSGETLGLVGESGSGKTTLARTLLGLTAADAPSRIDLAGRSLAPQAKARSLDQAKALQIVFQNPDSALNRSHTVRRLIGRAIGRLARLAGKARDERLIALTRAVRLADRYLGARPRQLSGGLKQRVAIARAFAGDPQVVICDEPTSALDVSVQAAILNLLAGLQAKHRVSYILISHDLGVVRYLSDRIAVLYLGRLMQIGRADRVFDGPHHPYTEALLSAIPDISGKPKPRVQLKGEIPSAVNPPSGCVFQTRCPHKLGAICEQHEPPLTESALGEFIRCHIPPEKLSRKSDL
ncbi:dipeptide ABC transporter ATP-binding protein [Dongia sp.]|uniref:dipeptide ABC transporter ATP-binding protein n=1 Tax=Dongia sp. TaxID=1977262 RepID=UPI003750A9BF